MGEQISFVILPKREARFFANSDDTAAIGKVARCVHSIRREKNKKTLRLNSDFAFMRNPAGKTAFCCQKRFQVLTVQTASKIVELNERPSIDQRLAQRLINGA